jgi:uncharacterized protein YkwD
MRGSWLVVMLAMVAVPSLPAYPQSSGDAATVVAPLTSPAPRIEVRPDAEAALLDLLNQVRRQHQLPALAMDVSLRQAARSHSRDMAAGGFVGHGSPAGTSFVDRLAGVVAAGSFVGENVTLARSVEQAHSAFVASTRHLRNILEPRFRRVGIGVVAAGELGLFITQDFAD